MSSVSVSSERLAVDGGIPIRSTPFPRWPHYAEDEVTVVSDVLRSGRVNYWTGEETGAFESEYADRVGRKHAIALANGTLALELGLRSLRLEPGDEVIVTSRSFVASASAIVLCGGRPVFVDVEPHSQNMSAETIAPAITDRTRAVVVVHLAGWPCDMDDIMALAREHDLFVIEDCAQAHGATYRGKPVGAFGDMAAFSFCQDKIITTCGEGGMLLLDDTERWKEAWAHKDHGKSYDTVHNTQHPEGFRWLHESIGTNWRITELQSAVGRLQLRKLQSWVAHRRDVAATYNERFATVPGLVTTLPGEDVHHAYYKYYVLVNPDALRPGWDRTRILAAVRAEGVPCFAGSCPEIYREKAFPSAHQPVARHPVAQDLGERSLMLETHPSLGERDVDDTCRAVERVLQAAAK